MSRFVFARLCRYCRKEVTSKLELSRDHVIPAWVLWVVRRMPAAERTRRYRAADMFQQEVGK